MFDVGMMCELSLVPTPTSDAKTNRKNRFAQGGTPISFAADSLASRYLLPAGVRLNVIRAGSGRISLESFASFDPDSYSWRTCQGFLFEDMEDLACSLTLPKWGLMRTGRLYRRAPLVRPISGKGCSLLPTPRKSEGADCPSERRRHTPGLSVMAKLIPTATSTDHKRGYSGQAENGRLSPSIAGGPINPAWLEHLMGFPIGWSSLPED